FADLGLFEAAAEHDLDHRGVDLCDFFEEIRGCARGRAPEILQAAPVGHLFWWRMITGLALSADGIVTLTFAQLNIQTHGERHSLPGSELGRRTHGGRLER